MRYLIDSHVFLWFNEGLAELSDLARTIIEDKSNQIFISIASLWEISIKNALGKLSIASGDYETVLDDVIENEMEILPVNFAHTVVQNKLPFHHKDPFDRIIVSQAIVENVDLISIDAVMDLYLANTSVNRIW